MSKEKYESEELYKLVGMAKEIILKFVEDKFQGKISTEQIKSVIENTKFTVVPNNSLGIGGTYHGHPNKNMNMGITFPENIFNNDVVRALGTIIHELSHKFSHEVSQGEILSKPIEEGMADLFSEECMNYFLKEQPEKLKGFAIKEGKKYVDIDVYAASSDYIGERSFIKSILEVVRQKTGQHYDVEFEYVLGDKNKFIEIIRETLGDECIEIIMQQKRDNAELDENYDKSYNERLYDIIERIPLQDIEKNREDGTYNVYFENAISGIVRQQEISRLLDEKGIDVFDLKPDNIEVFKKIYHAKGSNYLREKFNYNILQGYIRNCTDIGQIEDFLSVNEFFNSKESVIKQIELMSQSSRFSKVDVIQVIGKKIFELGLIELTQDTIDELSLNIGDINVEELTEDQISGLMYISLQCKEPNKEIYETLEKLKDTDKVTPGKKIGINLGMIANYEGQKGVLCSEFLEEYWEMTDEIEPSIFDAFVPKVVGEFLENGAKDEPEALNKIITKLKEIENKQKNGEKLTIREGAIGFELKEKCLELINKDREVMGHLIPKEILVQIREGSIPEENLSESIQINDIYLCNLQTLLGYNRKTKIVNMFNENIIAQVLSGRVLEGSNIKLESMTEQERTAYLGTINGLLDSDRSGIETISEIKELCNRLIPGEPKKGEENEDIAQSIRNLISRRGNPIQDLTDLYKCKIPKKMSFIYEELMANLENGIKRNSLGQVSPDLIGQLIEVAPNNTRIQEQLTKILEKQYVTKPVTTEQFLRETEDLRMNDIFRVKRIYDENGAEPYNEMQKREQRKKDIYLKMRTEAYLKSIGKNDNEMQQKLLLGLQYEQPLIKNPQYIPYKTLEGMEDFIIIGSKAGEFAAFTESMTEIESSEDILTQQNRGKRGIRGLFKKKQDKEMITESIVLEKKDDIIQAINRYETGRYEIVEMSQGKFRLKVLNRGDISLQDIGNNGAIVEKESFVERVDETEINRGRENEGRVTHQQMHLEQTDEGR